MTKQKNILERFEKQLDLDTQAAAMLLGMAYPRYMEFRRGARDLKPYHLASVEAHLLLDDNAMQKRVRSAKAMTK